MFHRLFMARSDGHPLIASGVSYWPTHRLERCSAVVDSVHPSQMASSVSARRMSVAMLDLPDDLERRLRAAWRGAVLLGYPIELSQWNGRGADVVIVLSGDVCARLVCDLAIRSRSRVVEVGKRPGGHTDAGVTWDIAGSTDFDLIRRLVNVCRARHADGLPNGALDVDCLPGNLAGCGLPGLLAAHDMTGWITLHCGARRIRIHRTLSRIQAVSRDDLAEAARQLNSPHWRTRASSPPEAALRAETRLDSFLLDACLAAPSALPDLRGLQFRLVHWPDLGGREPEYAWVLAAMGLVLRQAPVGINRIAAQTGLQADRANAMVWALWASGALACVSGAGDRSFLP